MSDKEDKTKQIPIRVSPSTKKKWESFVADSEHSSLAGAIRSAMKDKFNPEETPDGGVDVDLDPIAQKIDYVLERLDGIEDRIDHIETSPSSDEDVIELAHRVRQIIPRVDSPDDLPSLSTASTEDDLRVRAMMMGTAGSIADAVGAEEVDTRKALDLVWEEDPDLHTVEDAGFERYYYDLQETGEEEVGNTIQRAQQMIEEADDDE